MRVDNPVFHIGLGVPCTQCPYADEHGQTKLEHGCAVDGKPFGTRCPKNAEEYADACKFTEEIAK